MNGTPPNSLFVETTVQIKRIAGPGFRKAQIEDMLSGRQVFTSSTVFREFQATVIQAFRDVKRTLQEIPASSPAHLRISEIDRVLADSPSWSGRQAQRMLWVTASIKEAFRTDDQASCEDVVSELDREIEVLSSRRFFRFGRYPAIIDLRASGGYLDIAECSVARDPLEPDGAMRQSVSCNSGTRYCSIRPLLGRHVEKLASVEVPLMPLDERGAKTAKEVSAWPDARFMGRAALGQRICWRLGDVIIALETLEGCPLETALVSYDSDFDAICPVVGIPWWKVPYK